MSLREMIDRNPAASAVAGGVLVIAAAAIAWYSMRPATYNAPTKAYYTTDDGQTWFVDDLNRQTPFLHDGKEAVKAYLYTCDSGRSEFVAYLEKMPPGATPAAAAEEAPAQSDVAPKSEAEARAMAASRARKPALGHFLMLVKKPGDKQWLKSTDPQYFATMAPKCEGTAAPPDRVFP